MSRFGITVAIVGLALIFSEATASAQTVVLRIRFGMKDAEPTDWSGKLDVASGKVADISGTRWMPGDSADGNTFKVATRRRPAQSSADRDRIAAGQLMPMSDNGMVVLLDGVKPDAAITFDAKPGKHAFRLAEVPMGQSISALNGNLSIERVPASSAIADGMPDEDYPAIAAGMDGTVYVAYLSFTRGKDFQGARERPATAESGPNTGPLQQGEIRKIEKPEDFEYLRQPTGGEVIYLRTYRNGAWGKPVAVTDGKHEYYRPAVAVDGAGKVWVFYSAHLNADATLDHGNWEMMARSFDAAGKAGGETINLSNAAGSDFMPSAAMAADGKVWLAWVAGRGANFSIVYAKQDGAKFTAPARVSDVAASEWEPNVAASPDGRVAIAWDTYVKGDYDVHVAIAGKDGAMGKPQPAAATTAFEGRASMAFDQGGRLWLAYEASPELWGKDFGALKKKGAPLYSQGRYVDVRVMTADGAWMQPAANLIDAMPEAAAARRGNRNAPAANAGVPQRVQTGIAPSYPRLAVDAAGHVYLAFRGKPGSNWRVAVGSVWNEYITRLDAAGWSEAAWVPRSNNILDNRPAITAAGDGIMMAFSGDGRGEMNAPKVGDPHQAGAEAGETIEISVDVPDEATLQRQINDPAASDDVAIALAQDANPAQPARPRRQGGGNRRAQGDPNNDIFVTTLSATDFGGAAAGAPKLGAAKVADAAGVSQDTAAERNDVSAMRAYRYDLNGESLRIWRGEFHRHTELSPDGGGDGGLLDMWRYAIDCAAFDWIGDGDHDYGNGREYSWWTTQKAVTLFTLPGHFVPIYSYERSVVYPEGHRNCMFAQRGVRSLPRLPISSADKFAPAPDTNMLYQYLHYFKGVCASHTSATQMGTDWRNHDPAVEPFVEIYQGDRNNYERPDSPRSAVTEAAIKKSTPEKESIGGWRPKGFVNLALLKGYRLAFQSSSDHISTHLSYCNVLISGEPTREAILEAVRKRRVYGATDNIIADVRCKAGDKDHLMGEEFSTNEAPTLRVKIVGAKNIAKVTIIKDDVVVHEATPNARNVEFTWTDPKPTPGKTSYYYVRGEQVPDLQGATSGELVWASPMWIKYEGK